MTDVRLFDVVVGYLRSQAWPVDVLPEEGEALSRYPGRHGTWRCRVRTREEERQLAFYSEAPTPVPRERLPAVLEFVARANQDMVLGNFELDVDTGEVRFKTSVAVGPSGLTLEVLRPLVHANVLTMDQYLPGLVAVVDGRQSPEDACALCEA